MVMHSLYKVSQFRHYIVWYIKSRIQHKTPRTFTKKNLATKKRTALIVKDNKNNWI